MSPDYHKTFCVEIHLFRKSQLEELRVSSPSNWLLGERSQKIQKEGKAKYIPNFYLIQLIRTP
jgi:hypothetical protein